MKQTIELEIPEGYEVVEMRDVRKGDVYMPNFTPNYLIAAGDHNNGYKYPILRKTEQWRPATVADAIRALQGQTIKARFRDFIDREFILGSLVGVVPGSRFPWGSRASDSEGGSVFENYAYCEVLDV